MSAPAPRTPVLVGVGQITNRGAELADPITLAAEATRRALADCGAHLSVDTVAMPGVLSPRTEHAAHRLAAALDAARAHVELARSRLSAAERRERLARETREFFERSFRLGETDLPTRLRIELEAAEARRLAASARIDLAAAVSSLRQATGLLPQ